MRPGLATVVTLSCVMLTGCPTEAGNPPVSIQARSGDPSVVSFRTEGGRAVVDGLFIADGSIRLVTGEPCDRVGPPLVTGIRGDISAALPTGDLAPGETCGVFVALEASDESTGAPPELVGRSILVIGTRLDGSPFEISSAESIGIDVVSSTGPFVLTETGVILTLNMAPVIAATDLDAVSLDVDGVARVGPTREAAAAARFGDALTGAFELYEDSNDNGTLDAAEQARGALADSHPP